MDVIPEAPVVDTAAVAPTPDAAIPEAAPTTPAPSTAVRLEIGALLRPHWKSLVFAVLAVVGETAADIAEPWPVKIVVDNLLQSKRLPGWALPIIQTLGDDKIAILNFALGAVLLIAAVGAISSYFEKYRPTTVGQAACHDRRH